jgi:hypothetical protein
MMDTLQINAALCSHPITSPYFRGTFPADQLPRCVLSRPSILVANTDKADAPGEHWVGFMLPSEEEVIEYYDSFGLPPNNPSFNSFVQRNARICVYNNNQVQHYLSDSCGMFVCVFLLFRCKGFSISSIKEMFSNQTEYNEKEVKRLFALNFSGFNFSNSPTASSYCGLTQIGR